MLDMSLNSMQFNRLITQKQNIQTGWNKPTFTTGVTTASLIDPLEFQSKKQDESKEVKKQGKLITERVMQASKDEQEYFKKTNKIFTKDAIKESKYKRQIPDYLRLMEDPSKPYF